MRVGISPRWAGQSPGSESLEEGDGVLSVGDGKLIPVPFFGEISWLDLLVFGPFGSVLLGNKNNQLVWFGLLRSILFR